MKRDLPWPNADFITNNVPSFHWVGAIPAEVQQRYTTSQKPCTVPSRLFQTTRRDSSKFYIFSSSPLHHVFGRPLSALLYLATVKSASSTPDICAHQHTPQSNFYSSFRLLSHFGFSFRVSERVCFRKDGKLVLGFYVVMTRFRFFLLFSDRELLCTVISVLLGIYRKMRHFVSLSLSSGDPLFSHGSITCFGTGNTASTKNFIVRFALCTGVPICFERAKWRRLPMKVYEVEQQNSKYFLQKIDLRCTAEILMSYVRFFQWIANLFHERGKIFGFFSQISLSFFRSGNIIFVSNQIIFFGQWKTYRLIKGMLQSMRIILSLL